MTTSTPPILKIRSQQVLEGLALLHPFVLMADSSGRIAWMSDRVRKHLGARYEDADRGAQSLLANLRAHLPHPEQLLAFANDLRQSRRAESVRLDLRTNSGERITVGASGFRVEAKDCSEAHYVIILRLETPDEARERDKGSAGAAEAIEFLSCIVDSSPDGVIATDRSGFITYANPAVERFLERRPVELVGKPIALLIPENDRSGPMLESLNTPWRWDGEEVEHVGRDGKKTWISVSTRPLRRSRDDGRASGTAIYLRDVTGRHEAQEALKQKNAELESYVDAVAHDLRSPLVSLLGFTGLLRQDYEDVLDQTGHHFLDRVEQAGRTMDALIYDLLELSRIRGPRRTHARTDPRAILLQIEAELKLRLDEHSIALSLPASPPMLPVEATHLYQVFSNLIGNAITHMGACDDPEIRVDVATRDGYHEIVVSDNGRGVAEEDRERIFEAFQTGSRPPKSRGRSSGIGLAIVRKIAETHGGRAWLESDSGPGARLHVTFPVA